MAPADVSALVTVYAGIDPDHFAEALGSIAGQTVPCREVVVVVDGPVSDAHLDALAVLDGARVIRLPDNVGSGLALAAGLRECTSTWVARFDADDLSEPRRLEVQRRLLEETGADVCSTALAEFLGTPDQVVGVRRTPTKHVEFARVMRTRNPVNQPSVVFRRALAEHVGGYQHLPFHEDYDLWARMLVGGAIFTGCAEPLVRFRADGMRQRRTSPEAVAAEGEQQRLLRSYGLIGPVRARTNLVLRTTYLRLPPGLMDAAYRLIFRVKGSRVDG